MRNIHKTLFLILIQLLSFSTVFSQCFFTLTSDSVNYRSCKYALENVVWSNLNNTAAAQNDIIKIAGGSGWNADATSTNKVYNNGFMQTIVVETNTNRMIGLNTVNSNANYPDLEYSFYLVNGGDLLVYENGSNKGNWGKYEAGDTLRIAVLDNQVFYIQNGNTIYVSSVTPTFPMFVDFSISTINGTLQDVVVGNATDSLYSVFEANPGGSPTYQWKLNGGNVGTGITTYVNNLNDGDVLECILTPSLGGCSGSSVVSNTVNIKTIAINRDVNSYIINDSVQPNSCLYLTEDVSWKTMNGITENGINNVIKSTNNTNWNAGAFSFNKIENGGYMQTIVNETNTSRMIGLNATNNGVNYQEIDYAFYLANNGSLNIYENGTNKGNWGAYSAGDTLQVAVVGNTVKYIQNGNIVYTSSNSPTLPLYVDMSLNTIGATIENITISNPAYGKFTANVDGLANVNYQWKLNNVNVGSNSASYTNISLNDGDSLVCEFYINGSSECGNDTSFTSNIIRVKNNDPKANLVFAIRNDSIVNQSCKYAYEQVAWQSITALTLNGTNNVTKTSGTNNWDAGAFSYNKVKEGGFMETIIAETNTSRMIGLNATNNAVNYQDLDYAFYLVNNGSLNIYENGASKGNWGAYSTGDTLRIAVVGNTVRYIQNGNIVYTSSTTPTLPLYVDMSLSTIGATLQNIYVNNTTYGIYTAFVDGANSVEYQWKLNGGNVGSNTPIYTNTSTTSGDIITCLLTITNTSDCSSDTTELSNQLVINEVSLIDNVLFSIRNDSIIENSCLFANENVAWQSATSLTLNGSNNVTKTSGTNNWDAGAFSYNQVKNGGFMQTIVAEINTSRMIGLNAINNAVNYQDLDYAFYLVNNGGLSIYENGSNRATLGSYSTGDTLRIAIINNVAKYYQNGNLVYTSSAAPNLPLYVDMSIKTIGGTLKNITVYNGMYGNFSAFISGANSVNYQWKLNGVNSGSNSPSYSNLSLNDGDQITSILSIAGTTGCGDTLVYSNEINIEEVPFNDFTNFYITREITQRNGCQFAVEDVEWESIVGLKANGNNLIKQSGTGSWNAGVFSFNNVVNNGFFQLVIPQTNKNLMIGLNSVNQQYGYQDIDYAIYFSGSNVTVYENGSNKGSYGTYSANDTFRIDVINNVVYYVKNNNIFYTSAAIPSLPLYVDASFSHVGASIIDAKVGNATYGKFRAIANNVGNAPTYQWQINGVNTGTNSNTYVNNAIKDNDVITCILSPDYVNCSGSSITSNNIIIEDQPPLNYIPDFTPITTTWNGTNTNWYDPSNWSNGIPFSDGKAIIPSGLGNYPAIPVSSHLYDLEIANSANLTLTSSAQMTLYHEWTNAGLFTTNTGTVEFRTCKDTSRWSSTNNITIYNAVMNNERNLIISDGNMYISDSLTFYDGIIYNDTNEIIFTDGTNWIGASESSHIDGEAQKIGNDAFTFPLGDSGYYNPIGISPPALLTDEFKARFHRAEPMNRYVIDPSLDHISSVDYWNLDRITGNSNLIVTLYWNSLDHYITSLSDLVVSHYDGISTEWENMGGLAAGSPSAGSVISTVTFTNYSPVTFGSVTGVNPLPIELVSFNANPNNNQVDLTWITSSEINNDYFTIERSANGVEWKGIKKVKGAGNSSTTLKYLDIDKDPLRGISYYRLKQTDFNGDYSYSETVTVHLTDKGDILIYPNPVKNYLTITNLCDECSINVYNTLGKLIFSGSEQKINTEAWSKGIYQVVIIDASGIIKNNKIIK